MNQHIAHRIRNSVAALLAIIAIGIFTSLIVSTFHLPSLVALFSQSFNIQLSGIALFASISIILLFIINLLHTSNLQHKKQRMIEESKNEFISLVSHQLRTPLSAVNWYTESLLDGQMNTEQKDYIQNIRQSNQRMIAMVDSILNTSEIELNTFGFSLAPVNVATVIDQVIGGLQYHINKKEILIKKELGDHLDNVITDERYLRIVIDNLLLNAIKYSPDKTMVVIRAENETGKLSLEVSDQGYGIPKADQSKIFSKLFRAHNILQKDTDGMGLGLYMTKAVIERGNGKIYFTSVENKGTTFFVDLPVHHKKA